MDAREPLVSIRDLRASYRTDEATIPAVRGVSLDLYPGEVLALVGESASGKSTVAHAILGLLPGSAEVSGDVLLRGQSLFEMDDEELRRVRGREIAVIFQHAQSSLTPTLTIGEQMGEIYRAHTGMGRRESEAAAIEALRPVLPDPERIAASYPFQLSGGMAQRVMIAMAMALGPPVVIADEPTANLDPAIRQETLERLEAIRDEGAAVLAITHDFGVVARIADRVAVMYAGEVVEQTDVRSIFREPRHPYTFGLLQSLPSLTREGRLQPMRGQPPDLAALPDGCPFLPRCPKATSRCRLEGAPPLEPLDGDAGHLVACYNPMVVPLQE
jgi:oligopeptide/dipeptide ABC transporter ATP-binding protein